MGLERVALGQGLATPRLVGQQTFRHRGRRVDAVEVAMRPGSASVKTPGGRTDHELDSRGTGDGRCLLIQGVRIERRVAVPETAVVRVPRTRCFGAALEDTKIR